MCSIVIALSLLLGGCSRNIKSDAFHQLQVGSPLSELKKKDFAIKEFVDVRGMPPQRVGRGQGGFNEMTIDQPVATVITSAIKKEFERNGHNTLLYSPESKSDFIIEGTVYRFLLINKFGVFGPVEYVCNVAVKFTVIPTFDANKMFVRKYEGEYSLFSSWVVSNATFTEMFDQALLAMIKNMSTDQELFNYLNN
jgi:uncharacterized lipoprotein YajG